MKRLPLILLLCLLMSCSPAAFTQKNGFDSPDPDTYVSLMPYVREYFYYRKWAVINNDLGWFYNHYPSLAVGMDIDRGINVEGNHVRNLQSLTPIDGNIFPEFYEKIKIQEIDGKVQWQVHGMEIYLWKNAEGDFEESGGEFIMVLYLKNDGESWKIYKTDEVVLSEWKEE